MEKLNYTIRIKASKEKVWSSMLDSEKYKQWAKAFSPESQFRGEWKKGAYIEFIDPNMGGTKAVLEDLSPHTRIHVKHIAIIGEDGGEDTDSEVAQKWIGITETYLLNDCSNRPELSVEIHTHEDFVKMFDDCWPNALELLKSLCENDN